MYVRGKKGSIERDGDRHVGRIQPAKRFRVCKRETRETERERETVVCRNKRGEQTIDQVEKPVSGGTVKTLFEIFRANASINDALEFIPRHRCYEIVLCQRPCDASKILIVSRQSHRTYARLRKEPR